MKGVKKAIFNWTFLYLIGFVDSQCCSVGLSVGPVDSPSIQSFVRLDSMGQLTPKLFLLDSPMKTKILQ